jgi:hypothetical protein
MGSHEFKVKEIEVFEVVDWIVHRTCQITKWSIILWFEQTSASWNHRWWRHNSYRQYLSFRKSHEDRSSARRSPRSCLIDLWWSGNDGILCGYHFIYEHMNVHYLSWNNVLAALWSDRDENPTAFFAALWSDPW